MNHNEIFNVSDLIDIPASFWPNVSTKMRHTCSTYHNTKKNLNPLFSQTEADKKYLELNYSEPKYSEPMYSEPKYSEPQYSEPKFLELKYSEPRNRSPIFRVRLLYSLFIQNIQRQKHLVDLSVNCRRPISYLESRWLSCNFDKKQPLGNEG